MPSHQPRRTIIAFGHKLGRGKSTCANLVLQTCVDLQVPCASDSLMTSLKLGLGKGVFGLTNEQCYGLDKRKVDPFWGFTPRTIFQRGGKAMREAFGANVWIKTFVRRTLRRVIDGQIIVVDDLHLRTEAATLRELGATLVKVVGPQDVVSSDSGPSGGPPFSYVDAEFAEDEINTDLDDFDWDATIYNTGSFDYLRMQVISLLPDILEKIGVRTELHDPGSCDTIRLKRLDAVDGATKCT